MPYFLNNDNTGEEEPIPNENQVKVKIPFEHSAIFNDEDEYSGMLLELIAEVTFSIKNNVPLQIPDPMKKRLLLDFLEETARWWFYDEFEEQDYDDEEENDKK